MIVESALEHEIRRVEMQMEKLGRNHVAYEKLHAAQKALLWVGNPADFPAPCDAISCDTKLAGITGNAGD